MAVSSGKKTPSLTWVQTISSCPRAKQLNQWYSRAQLCEFKAHADNRQDVIFVSQYRRKAYVQIVSYSYGCGELMHFSVLYTKTGFEKIQLCSGENVCSSSNVFCRKRAGSSQLVKCSCGLSRNVKVQGLHWNENGVTHPLYSSSGKQNLLPERPQEINEYTLLVQR